MKKKIALVYSDHIDDYSALCSGAASMADEVTAVVIGTEACAEQAAEYADKVFMLKNDGSVMDESYIEAMAQIAADEKAEVILLPVNKRTRHIAGKLSAKLDAPVVPDTGDIQVCEEGIEIKRMVYGGTAIAKYLITADTCIIGVSSGTFEVGSKRNGSVIVCDMAANGEGVERTEIKISEIEEVDLTKARIIVSVGRGIGEEAFIATAKELAEVLGAELACSRPIGEEHGWLPISRFVGISGTTVKPNVYLAIGISGQIQHMIGCNNSRKIIAINKDENAPVFKQCDYGIVGDLTKVVPQMIALLK